MGKLVVAVQLIYEIKIDEIYNINVNLAKLGSKPGNFLFLGSKAAKFLSENREGEEER